MRNLLARFAELFWQGFYEARAQSSARAQPAAPLAPLEHMSEETKAVLSEALRGSFAEGAAAEKARFAAFFESEEYKKPLAAVVQAAFNDGVLHERARIAAAWSVGERDAVNRPTDSIFH
jgi:hypothetical protein